MATSHADSSEVLVKRLFARISEVSTLPTVAVRIVEVANDPMTDAEDLLEAVQFDAALAARILRTVNSSFYALQHKIDDLKLAITLMGFKEIRNLAMTAYIAQLFKQGSGHGTYTREGLWNHLIGTGTVARLVAETCGKVSPREAYLAGLLHDLGLILLDQYLHQPFSKVVDAMTEETPLTVVETGILGFDHTELGEYVATKWNLPEHVIASIRYHHRPLEYETYRSDLKSDPCGARSDYKSDPRMRDMVYVVALADFFTNVKSVIPFGVRGMQLPPTEVFTGLGLEKPQIRRLWEQLDETLRTANVMAMMHVGSSG